MKKRTKLLYGILIIPFLFSCSSPVGNDGNSTVTEDTILEFIKNIKIDSEGYPENLDEDSDGDGLTNAQEKDFGTNPFMTDTDGDGFNDYEEAMELYVNTTNAFNPCVADLPKIEMTLTSRPKIVLSYTHSTETAKSESIEIGSEKSKETSSTNSYTYTAGLEHSWSVGVEFGVEDSKFTGKIALGYNGTSSTEDSWGYEQSSTVSAMESLTKANETSQSEGYEYDGGKMLFGVKFINKSDVAYTVNSLSLDAYRVDPTKEDFLIPIGKLVPQNSDGSFTIAQKGQIETIYSLEGLTLDEIEEILKYSNAITVRISGYNFTFSKDGNETDFTGILTASAAKTASVTIDYGPAAEIGGMKIASPTESFKAATKTFVNANATNINELYNKVPLSKILKSSGINKAMEIENNHIKSIRGIKDTDYSAWYIYHTTTDAYTNTTDTTVYKASETPIDSIKVETQDCIDFLYSVDEDEDGIPLRVENMFGSSDTNKDSDGDTISDYDEIIGKVQNSDDTTTTTNPISTDSDWDLIPDNEDDYPSIPKIYDDPRIESISYRMKTSNTYVNLFSMDKNKDKSTKEYSLSLNSYAMDSIFIKLKTVIPGSIINCIVEKKTGKETIKVTSEEEFEISGLAVGDNNIQFEVTSTDLKHKAVYKLKLNSVLESPDITTANINCNLSNKMVSIPYKVNDSRITDVVVYIVSNSYSEQNITKTPSIYKGNTDICFATLNGKKAGTLDIPFSKYNTTYTYKVFSMISGEACSTAVQVQYTTGNAPKGYFTIGLHSLESVWSDDEGTDKDCEYFWLIKANDNILSEKTEEEYVPLSGGHKSSTHDNDQYYFFKDNKTSNNLLDDSKTETNCIRQAFSYEKKDGQTFSFYIRLQESDNSSADDTIHDGYFKLTYTASTDTWKLNDTTTCKLNSATWIETTLEGADEKLKLRWFIKWEDDNGQDMSKL